MSSPSFQQGDIAGGPKNEMIAGGIPALGSRLNLQ
jgi:hypothetical protein